MVGRQLHRTLGDLGPVATRAQVLTITSRGTLDALLADGTLRRVSRGRYAFTADADTADTAGGSCGPSPAALAGSARVAAHRLSGVAAYRTAALHWRLPMKWSPERPCVVVPRGRRVEEAVRAEIAVSWRTLDPRDVVDGWVTTPLRTALDCAATLPFDEGLAIADSALRSGRVRREQLAAAAARFPARGHNQVARVVAAADARAQGPFESVLRAVASGVPGLHVVPQVRIVADGRFLARVDLADEHLRIVLEADSFEFHGKRLLFERDCRRYDELVAAGWLVLRFSWEQVMTQPDWVRDMLVAAVALRRRQGLTHRRPLVAGREH